MSEGADVPSESLFRASKRRKVFRKRTTEEDAPSDTVGAIEANPGPQNEDLSEQPSVVRRPAAKKHGISFSNNAIPGDATVQSNTQLALVPVVKQDEADVAQTDRFMKPTGKVVIEDKHLTAYVDSKLAELRSSTSTPTSSDAPREVVSLNETDVHSSVSTTQPPIGGISTTNRDAIHGISNSQRRAQVHADRMRQKQRRRQPQIDSSATARDAMVDRIMQESQVPMYDRPSAGANSINSDEAAAEAFKAEFLAGLEEQNRRKPLAPPPAARGAQNASPATGPKLGGSRQQREKMKAIEEAKAAAGKK